ncbi:hypothetical protein [Algoriphagus sp. NG3]|uniref:hypothetical protein n=1 Tax=Algoriphagus sp. NG3 TaxID=3097546 RepID=UPI002A817125|nr:hypothetical protein [Algoriphagus sp. NG3]WPR77670.1 hypothetical protein SLW71_09975 [Algoriphagus sp. NG3]
MLELSSHQLILENGEALLTISNSGNVPVTWTLDSPNEELSISPYTGILNPGENVETSVKVFKDQLVEGLYGMGVNLSTDKEIFYHVNVQVPIFEEQRWKLDEQLVDVEYDYINDRIVAVNSSNTLLLIDPFTQQIDRIHLSFPAVCVSMSLDGKSAIVGHKAAFSRIDLDQKEILIEKGLPIEVSDLVEGPNGWVYIVPTMDITRSVYNYNWNTGEQGWSNHSDVYANSIVRISPNGKYLYSLPTNVSPPDVVKMSLGRGKTEYLYDSPYHGDYHFGNNFWIAADGEKLFTNSGNVFVLSENPTFDLTYYGKLKAEGSVIAVSQLAENKNICAIHNSPSNYAGKEGNFLAIYSSSLELLQKIDLPSYYYKDNQGFYQVAQTDILYGYPSLNDKYVIVSKSNLNYTGEQVFAIQILNLY